MKRIAPRISVDEAVRAGKPVVEGTRVGVDVVLGHLAAGMTPGQIAQEYDITVEDVHACIAYAARLVAEEQVRAVPK
jgi:uncharacterized protein (DUF433 family)